MSKIDKKPLKVLMLVTRLNIGGPAVQVVTLASKLPADRFETTLVCGSLGAGEGDMGYLAVEAGVRPVIITELVRELSFLKDLKAFVAIVRLILVVRPDIVHTHTAKAGTIGRAAVLIVNAGRLADKKISVVHTFHGHTFHSYFGKAKTALFRVIEKILSGFTDRIVAISSLQREDICHRYRVAAYKKVTVIPLGFDLSRFGKSTPQKKSAPPVWFSASFPDRFVSGIVGRLTRVKNPQMVLEVAGILKGMGKEKEFGFVFVGDGELNPGLKQMVRKRGIDTMVRFTGWLADTSKVYPELDAVILTSLNEGTPVSLIEAMASEKPVIATAVGGVGDLMGEALTTSADGYRVMEHGILVDAEDAEAMALALVRMKRERVGFEKRAETAGYAMRTHYTTEKVVEKTTLLYMSLSGGPASDSNKR